MSGQASDSTREVNVSQVAVALMRGRVAEVPWLPLPTVPLSPGEHRAWLSRSGSGEHPDRRVPGLSL